MLSELSASLPRRRLLAMLGTGLAIPLLAACGGAASATVSTGSVSVAPATTATSAAPAATASASSAATTAAASVAATTSVASTSSVAASTSAATTASSSAAAAAPGKGKTAIEFWQWGAGYQTGFEGWAKTYNDRNSTVQVNVTKYATNNNQKITVAVAGGAEPDAYLSDSDGFKNRAYAGLEGSIDDLAARDKTATDNFKQMLPSAVDWYTFEGKRFGVPWDYSAGVVVYNIDMLRPAGLALPSELAKDPKQWTWDTLQQYATKLTVKNGTTPDRVGAYLSWGGYENSWYSMALANGGSYYNQALDQCTIGSPECVEALDFVVSMAKSGIIATPSWWKTITTQYKKSMEPFLAGKVAMQYTGDWNFKPIVDSKTTINWDVAILPYAPKTGKTGNWSNLRGLVMPPNGKHRDETFQFLAYMGTTEVQDTITATLAEVPMRMDSAGKTYLVAAVAGPPAGRATLKPALDATTTDGTPYVNEDDAYSNMDTAGQKAVDGQISAKDALTALQSQMNGLIQAAKANKK
ncbi:MAG: extracellular solute-binding protein [Chloroflexota bacterium]